MPIGQMAKRRTTLLGLDCGSSLTNAVQIKGSTCGSFQEAPSEDHIMSAVSSPPLFHPAMCSSASSLDDEEKATDLERMRLGSYGSHGKERLCFIC